MNNREQLSDIELNSVIGAGITFNPDYPGAVAGRIGIDQNYAYRYDNIDSVTAFIGAHKKDKEWTSIAERDNYLLQGLINAGIIH